MNPLWFAFWIVFLAGALLAFGLVPMAEVWAVI